MGEADILPDFIEKLYTGLDDENRKPALIFECKQVPDHALILFPGVKLGDKGLFQTLLELKKAYQEPGPGFILVYCTRDGPSVHTFELNDLEEDGSLKKLSAGIQGSTIFLEDNKFDLVWQNQTCRTIAENLVSLGKLLLEKKQ